MIDFDTARQVVIILRSELHFQGSTPAKKAVAKCKSVRLQSGSLEARGPKPFILFAVR